MAPLHIALYQLLNPISWRGFFCISLLGSLVLSVPAIAATHLLLVAADRYAGLPPARQLPGVRNDVGLMHSTFSRVLEPISIIELSERKEARAKPTSAAILDALTSLQQTTRSGDWVVAYFAGHGTQIPAEAVPGNIEPDSLDEAFLASDVQRWDGVNGRLPGAISDNVIHDWWRTLRQRNVAVWLIFDTCHAGDMAKGVAFANSKYRRERFVPPAELGIPGITQTRTPAKKIHEFPQVKGLYAPLVAFYAAQPDELTTEEPIRLPDGRIETHGIYTFALASALQGDNPSDLAALSEAILARYRADRRLFPTPAFAGPLKSVRPWGAP